jgi:hypothetical protein
MPDLWTGGSDMKKDTWKDDLYAIFCMLAIAGVILFLAYSVGAR